MRPLFGSGLVEACFSEEGQSQLFASLLVTKAKVINTPNSFSELLELREILTVLNTVETT